jgi:hypothetical protein
VKKFSVCHNSFKVLLLIALSGLFFAFNSIAQTPTLVIFNADIRTMDAQNPKAQAVAITDNKISAVGTNAEIKRLIGTQTKTIDAQGKLVIPGFNDSHTHFHSIGARFFFVRLKNVKTPAEVIEKLKYHAKFLSKKAWIIGGFETQGDFPLQIIPAKELIDAAAPEHPVMIYLKGVQIIFANSRALKLAGIDKNSKEIKGVMRRADGEPTGILQDSAVNLVRRLMPYPDLQTPLPVLETATNYAASMGVTSVQDVHSDKIFEPARQLAQQGNLKNRIYECISLTEWQKLANRGIRRASGDAMVREGCLKYFSDGDEDLFNDIAEPILAADKADLQVMMHAIGGAANDLVLRIYEKVQQENGSKDRRFRIEHAHNFRPPDLKRFVATKTIASMQPALFFDGSGDDARLFRQMLDSKALLAFGSDANIIDLNPLAGIHAAVYGENSKRGMTVEEAVRAYTLGSAYAEFQEQVKGSITVGKFADLVILSENIFTIKPNEIKKVKVLQTIMDGRIVYTAE